VSTPTQEIYYNVTGQTIWHDAIEGRPSSITSVSVFPLGTGDDGTSENAISDGSQAVETNPNTTVDATSGLGQTLPRKVSLTATTGIEVGRSYLLTGLSGEREWVEVMEISAGDFVTVRSPLHNSFAASSTFQSTRLSFSIGGTWVADSSNISDDLSPHPGYRIRWVYVYDSNTVVADTYVDLVRYKGSHSVTPSMMERFLTSWRNLLPSYHREDGGRALIDEAYQQLKFDLYAYGMADEMLRDREAVDELVKQKAREVLLLQRFYETGAGPEIADDARTQYQARLQSLVTRTTKVPMATGTDGSGKNTSPIGIWRK
jgi:hypothetical protein